jgi:drug/metabolite transporter (DMT)-like permease
MRSAPGSPSALKRAPEPNLRVPNVLRNIDWRVAAALAATYFFFGSGPAAAAAGIKSFPPFLMVACRGLMAGVILVVWAFAEGAPRPSWRECRRSALIGILILACGAGAGTYGQLTVPSGVAGVLSALLPLIAAVIGYVLFREKLPFRAVVGLLVGFAGIGLLLRPGSGLDVFGVAVICGGQLAWAAGAELAPRLGLPEEPRLAAGLELVAGGAVLLAVASALGDWGRLDLAAVSSVSWAGFAWFIVIAVGGFTAFGYLSQTVAPSIATTFSYVNPIVAMTLGWLLYSEPITWRMLIATAVIVIGVCAIVSTKSEAPAKTRHPMTSGYGYRRVLLEPSPGN